MHDDCTLQSEKLCDLCFVTKGERKMAEVKAIEVPDVIRRTYIETYRTCPYKFLKQVIEGNENPPTSYTQIGIDLHEIFEDACLGDCTKKRAMERIKGCFDLYPEELFGSGFASDNVDDMWKRAVNSIDTFYDIVLPVLPYHPFITEKTIEFSVGEDLPKVQFTMDRIDEIDGELHMHDWKTGKVMVGQKLTTDLQAPLYIYGTRKHYGKPVKSFTFHYLNENKFRRFERTEREDVYACTVGKRVYYINLLDGVREIQRVFAQIKKGNFNIPQGKNMHFHCKVCHLKKQGLCQGADIQEWNNAQSGFGWK